MPQYCIILLFILDFQIKYFDRYGRKNGFTTYVLRYFLRLNLSHNLHITEAEMMVAIACVFSKVDLPRYQSLQILPTTRCVTLFNWLQVLYDYNSCFHTLSYIMSPSETISLSQLVIPVSESSMFWVLDQFTIRIQQHFEGICVLYGSSVAMT